MVSFRRHMRFLVAFGLGLTVWTVTSAMALDPVLRVLIAANSYFVVYLVLLLRLTLTTSVDGLRRHAEADDEGSVLILMLAIVAVAVSMTAIFLVLNRPESLPVALFALAAAPLGWALTHILVAYRYAHLFYSASPDAGLAFPDAARQAPPGVWDFLYFSFTIGMTAQVSDVEVNTVQMRKVVLLHSIGSFFYNTVILALAVNAGLALGR